MQLTSGETEILGFVTLPIFARTKDGVSLRFELEAYVVRDMAVPVLLAQTFSGCTTSAYVGRVTEQ